MKTATGNGTRFASYSVIHSVNGVMTETFGARTEAEAIAQAQTLANESQSHATARKTGWERCVRVTVWTNTIEPEPYHCDQCGEFFRSKELHELSHQEDQ